MGFYMVINRILWFSIHSWEWNFIIPTDFNSIIFQRGRYTTMINGINEVMIHGLWEPYQYGDSTCNQWDISMGYILI